MKEKRWLIIQSKFKKIKGNLDWKRSRDADTLIRGTVSTKVAVDTFTHSKYAKCTLIHWIANLKDAKIDILGSVNGSGNQLGAKEKKIASSSM